MRASVKSKKVKILIISLMIILSTSLIYSLISSNHEILFKSYQSTQSSKLFVLGDVDHVLNGNLSSYMYFKQNTSGIVVALGAGAFGSMERTGEMLIFDGRAYVKPSDPSTNYKMETSTEVLTPFCFGLEEGNNPSAIYFFENEDNETYTLSELYQMIAKNHDRTLAVLGVVEFNEIHHTAVKLAPIYNESIIAPENIKKYFHDQKLVNDRVGIIVGVINDPNKESKMGYDSKVESKMFYINPAEKASSTLLSHTHILITADRSIESNQYRSADDVIRYAGMLEIVEMSHLLMQSTLKKAIFMIYDVNSVVEIARDMSPECFVQSVARAVSMSNWSFIHFQKKFFF